MADVARRQQRSPCRCLSAAALVVYWLAFAAPGAPSAPLGPARCGAGPAFLAASAPLPRRATVATAVAAALPFSVAVQPALAVREGFTETPSGLQFKVVKEGTGSSPQKGQRIAADYTGWLEDFESEKKFDSSRDRRQPLEFPVGVGKVIKGWDEALLDMKAGERRLIIVPPQIGYGNRAIGPIPAGSTLYFDVELRSIGR
mmetsp:Transcript_119678/g.334042  ORF Transcript_119678/g.334042 Transcript_119678/m.334042 type:complete len:201 (-) Transcript_119678:147-749(-)